MKVLLTVDPEIAVPPKLYGGIERVVDGLAAELRAQGHVVGLIGHPESTCEVDAFFGWPGRFSRNRTDSVRNTLWLYRIGRQFRPDVVHSFSRLGYLLPLLLRRQPAVMSYQRHTGGGKLKLMATLGGRRFAYTACSEYIAQMGRKQGGDWTVIPNFVDTNFYSFVPSVKSDAPLVFLSRVESIKGTHTAIKIALGVRRRLVIAGNRVESEKGRAYWNSEVQPHLRPGIIDYVGAVNDAQKNQLLGNAAALLVPVEWEEPFGIVFVESLACGTPVIASPLGALPEIVENGRHGFLVNSAAEGIAAVMKVDNISRAECRARAESTFSRRVVGKQYESLYWRVCSSS